MIQENRQIKHRDIALKLGISQENVHHITETLNYIKYARQVGPEKIDRPHEGTQENCCSRTS